MALMQRLDLRQSQALVMTPQLQQAIKLLQLSNLELSSYVEGELEQNPLLEHDDGPAEGAPAEAEAEPAPERSGDAPLSSEPPSLAGEDVESWREAAGAEGE